MDITTGPKLNLPALQPRRMPHQTRPGDIRKRFYTSAGMSRFFPSQPVPVEDRHNQGLFLYTGCLIPPLIIGSQQDINVGTNRAYYRWKLFMGAAEYFGLEKYVLLDKPNRSPVYFFDDHRFWFFALMESFLSGDVQKGAVVAQLEFYTRDHLDFALPKADFDFRPQQDSPDEILSKAFDYAAHSLNDIDHNVAALNTGIVSDIYHFPVDPGHFALTEEISREEMQRRYRQDWKVSSYDNYQRLWADKPSVVPAYQYYQHYRSKLEQLTLVNTGIDLVGGKVDLTGVRIEKKEERTAYDLHPPKVYYSETTESRKLEDLLRTAPSRNSILVIDLDAFLVIPEDMSFRKKLDNRTVEQIPEEERVAMDRLAIFLILYMRLAGVSIIVTSPAFAQQDLCVYLSKRIAELY